MNFRKFCAVAASIFLSACGGGGGGGGSSQAERDRIENDPSVAMVDRVIFEQKQQAGVYQASSFATLEISSLGNSSSNTDLDCQELVTTDEDFLREDFTVRSGGDICAAAGGDSICFGQRASALRANGRDDLIFESLRVTSDEYSSVASIEVGYNKPGETSIETLVLSALSADRGCNEDQIEDDFSADDIAGDWKVVIYNPGAALPQRVATREITCTATSCTGSVGFGPITATRIAKGIVFTGAANVQGAAFPDTKAVLSTARTTFAMLACPNNTAVQNVMDNCQFIIGER